jgi:hypothetical protein
VGAKSKNYQLPNYQLPIKMITNGLITNDQRPKSGWRPAIKITSIMERKSDKSDDLCTVNYGPVFLNRTS